MATDLPLRFVKQGVPFLDAHHRVGKLVGYCRKTDFLLDNVSLQDMLTCLPEGTEECLMLCKPKNSVALRDIIGVTAPSQAKKQVEKRSVLLADE